MKFVLFIVIGTYSFPTLAGQMRAISMTSEQKWNAPRPTGDATEKISGPKIVQEMVKVRRAQTERHYAECAKLAHAAGRKAAGLKFWLATAELDCANRLVQAEGSKHLGALQSALNEVEKNQQWLTIGPQVKMLKPLFFAGEVLAFENEVKVQRKVAWDTYDILQQWLGDLSSEQRSRVHRAAGELAFLEQNLSLAIDQLTRSLSEQDSSDVRRKLEAIVSTQGKKTEVPKPQVASVTAVGEELVLQERMKQSINQGDLLSAIEDGVKLVEKFPGSQTAKWASDRVLEVYLSLGAKTESSYDSVRRKAVDQMLKADSARLFRWANNAYVRGLYPDALRLSDAAFNKYAGHPDATKAASVAANSALYSGDLAEATKWYEILAEQHGGTEESRQALFRLGLMRFRDKKYADTSAYMERLLLLAPSTDWEYIALHWHWRAQQRMKVEGSGKTSAERLMAKYPLTYYGLRARAELNGGVLKFDTTKAAPYKTEIWLSESQNQAWERLGLLLKAGWFDEAQAEIGVLPEPLTPEDQLVRARLLAAAFDHYNAVKMFNDVWTKKPELFDWNQAKTAFPKEYTGAVEKEGKSNDLDPDLIRSLIRQESTYRTKAVSAVNAYGLMQVLPATALEVSEKWKPPLVLPDDLMMPEVNIRVGSAYLGRMVRAFKGNVPLALAAYNAGIGRVRKWLAARTDLAGLESKRSSAPEDEIWIDEMPWDETSFYVKAVLRNLLVYEAVAKNEVKIPEPIWNSRAPQ